MSRCNKQAVFRYTWPGEDEAVTCFEHAWELEKIADAIGLHLQFIPLPEEERLGRTCPQNVKEEEQLW